MIGGRQHDGVGARSFGTHAIGEGTGTLHRDEEGQPVRCKACVKSSFFTESG